MNTFEILILLATILFAALTGWFFRALIQRIAARITGLEFFTVLTIVIVAIIAIACFPAQRVHAQAYYTNSNYVAGPYQYNAAFVPPYNAGVVISNQVSSGICNGSIQPGAWTFTTGLESSNNFSCYYSQPPSISAISTLSGTNSEVWLVLVTKTNFVIQVESTNANTVYWTAVGH